MTYARRVAGYVLLVTFTAKEATVPNTDDNTTTTTEALRDLGNQRTSITLALIDMRRKRAEVDAAIERETQRMQDIDATITDLVNGKHFEMTFMPVDFPAAPVKIQRAVVDIVPAKTPRKAVLRKRVADKPNPFQDGSARWAIYEYLIKMTKPEHIKQIHASLNGGGSTERYKYRSVEATVYYFKTRGYVDVSEGIVRSKLV